MELRGAGPQSDHLFHSMEEVMFTSLRAVTQLSISATLEILLLEQRGLCQYVLGFAKVA